MLRKHTKQLLSVSLSSVACRSQLDISFGGCIAGALIRLGLDQLLWAPVFISTFLASLLTLEVRLYYPRCSNGQAVPVLLMSSPGALGPACIVPCTTLMLLQIYELVVMCMQ